jgi:hypothetical protein
MESGMVVSGMVGPETALGLKRKPPGAIGQADEEYGTLGIVPVSGKTLPRAAGTAAKASSYRVERRLAVISPFP